MGNVKRSSVDESVDKEKYQNLGNRNHRVSKKQTNNNNRKKQEKGKIIKINFLELKQC